MTDWLEICVVTQNEQETEAVADALQLFAIDDEGVAIEQAGDPNDVDPKALLPETLVKLFIDVVRDSAEIRQTITDTLVKQNLPVPTYNIIREQDWANAWKENYKPLRIGKRFWIRPSWLADPAPNSDDIVIQLDPGMAFGTGTHETTRLCLALLEEYVERGSSMLDVGCGSGILAIGAAKLGAQPILAFDNDPLAIDATEQNSADNQVDHLIETQLATLSAMPKAKWDVVVANILAPVLQELLANDSLLDHVESDGVLILSGILDVQAADMVSAIETAGGTILKQVSDGDWVALVAQPR